MNKGIYESYITECLIVPRNEDNGLFTLRETETGFEVLAKLKGYAIFPIEEYNELIRRPPQEKPADCQSAYMAS